MDLLKLLIVLRSIRLEQLLVVVPGLYLLFLFYQDTVKNRIQRFGICAAEEEAQDSQE
jgi:hypothetical protein